MQTLTITVNPISNLPETMEEFVVITEEGLKYLAFYSPGSDIWYNSEDKDHQIQNVKFWFTLDVDGILEQWR